jgi:periplasmic divalent cation tolerance protein
MDCCQLLLCTCPDSEVAATLAEALVENKLAACVNILPAIQSVFAWEGKVQREPEVLLLIKSRRTVYTQIETFISQQHPYDVPELIAFDIREGLPQYLQWIENSVSTA